MDNISDLQSIFNDIKVALSECKKTNKYLYIFTKVIPYEYLIRFVEGVLHKNKSKIIRLANSINIKIDVHIDY